MTFEIKPYPEFAWSISRQRKLDQCPRAYFFTYYLRLERLAGRGARQRRGWRTAWASSRRWTRCSASRSTCGRGSSRRPLAPARCCPWPMSWRSAHARRCAGCGRAPRTGRAAFERPPEPVTMLRSLYMEQDTQPETDRLNQKAGPCMQGLLATSHWERLRACGDAGRVEVPDFASFAHDGVKVFAAPDLAYVAGRRAARHRLEDRPRGRHAAYAGAAADVVGPRDLSRARGPRGPRDPRLPGVRGRG